MKRVKKRSFTLLETVIGLVLLSLLISFLLGFYSELESIHTELGKERRENFRLLYVQHRLRNVISKATFQTNNEKQLFDKRKLLFYVSKEASRTLNDNSLVLAYDNGVAHHFMSQDVLGRLYLDGSGRFCLASWPEPGKWLREGRQLEFSPVIREVLMENVESLAFEFYMPPDPTVVDKPPAIDIGHEKTSPILGQWQSDWPLTHNELPALVKVVIQKKGENGKEKPSQEWFIIPVNAFSKPVIYVK